MRLPRLAIVLGLAALLASCGSAPKSAGQTGELENSMKAALRKQNREAGAFSQVLNLRCRPHGPSPGYDCDASVRARAFVYRDTYRAVLGSDRCWTAARRSLGIMRGAGLDAEKPPHEALNGCIR